MNTSMRWLSVPAALIVGVVLTGCGSAQSRKAGYIQHGQKYLMAGNYDRARLEFRNAVQIDSKDANAHFLLAQVAEKTGDVREAVAQYQAAIVADPKHAQARAALARLYLFGALPNKAIELIQPGLNAEPDNAQFLTVRGAARAQLGNKDAALEDAKRAVQLAPTDNYAVALLASLYRQANDLDRAIAVAQAGLEREPGSIDLRTILADLELKHQNPKEAESQLRAIIALEPKNNAQRYMLARFYLQQNDIDGAERTVYEAVGADPQSVAAKRQYVDFLAAHRGRDRAVAQVDTYVSGEPKNDKLKLALGDWLARSGEPERAELTLRSVMAHGGTNADALAARDRVAALLVEKKNYDDALTLIAEVLKENTRDNDALVLRAGIALGRGQNETAIGDLRSVSRDQPNNVPVMRTLAHAYQLNGELDLAEETLRAAVQTSPKDTQSRMELAQVLIAANKLDQASQTLEQLSKDNPDVLSVQESLFRVQAAQKRTDDALATAHGIERANPKIGLGYYLSGLIEQAEKRPDAALRDYEQALQREPDAGEPLAAIVRLQLGRKQSQAAAARVDAVIAQSPGNVVARNLKAELLLIGGHADAAIAAYRDVLQVAPESEQGYHGLALAQTTSKKDDDAVESLRTGIEKTQGALTLVGDLSALYERLGRSEDAIALYDGVLSKNPSSSVAANNLAMLLITYRRDAASLARAQKLADQLASFPEPTMIDTRGWVRFKNGDYHGAESLLQQAVDKAPAAPDIRYHLGMAQMRSGEQQAAQQSLESALDANRPFVGIEEARATLAQLKKLQPVG